MQQNSSDMHTQRGAAVYSPLVLKLYDWWVLGISNDYAWKCPTRSTLLPFFQQHLSTNHLDVGVGTGYYLANSALPAQQKIALLDLNPNSLQSARARVPHVQPALIVEDILNPTGALGNQTFDSISLFYLLHCLPGRMAEKGTATFKLLSQHLTADGTLYGATILGDHVAHNWLGQRLMRVYNKKGIFGNKFDTINDLESALTPYFAHVNVWQQGNVALFTAKTPL